ncbi:hypothetical protein [Thaumasiovibrio subtropicus]|uniref:hypothetical protein n=1 Tax=Thaumasiovibrio subtropicus TaxID=1891207 RepID=UPI000B34D15D|nr:hypothetical protein [Thaumasiovibrio subtropicus]
MRFLLFIPVLMVLLSGCEIEITNGSSCSRTTDPSTGLRVDVYQQGFGFTTENGYDSRFSFTRHYECGPAYAYQNSGGEERFEYFKHGRRASSNHGFTDIAFGYDSFNQQYFKTNLRSTEHAQEYGWTRTGRLYEKRWPASATIDEIVVKNSTAPNVSESLFASADVNNMQKQKFDDGNLGQYQCRWLRNGLLVDSLLNCQGAAEMEKDRIHLGLVVDLMPFINDFQTNNRVSYSVDPYQYERDMRIR